VKVAFDGEVKMMRAPPDFRVLAKPLYLLKPQPDAAVIGARSRVEEAARSLPDECAAADFRHALRHRAGRGCPSHGRALRAQLRAARAFVDLLGATVLAVPGNHDIPLFDLWARLRSPYGRYSAAFGTDLEPVHHSPELLVVCVNITRPWRHEDGEVSALQIDHVARLRGHAAALQRWAEAGADLVMGGHIHLPYVMPAPGLARALWVVQAGIAVSSRVRDGSPNSVNLLRWGKDAAPGCCRIEQWDYDADDRTFRLAKASEVRLDRA
jgi:hypothetical protein